MITVIGPVLLGDGRPFIGRMRLEPLWLPMNLLGDAVISGVLTVNAKGPDGLWDDYNAGGGLQLAPGAWMASFPSAPGLPSTLIAVPDGEPATEAAFADLIGPATSEATALDQFFMQGNGSPEGVVVATRGLYWDLTNKALFVKDSVVGNAGWREVIA